jgi:hypothetical protein
MSSFAKEKPRKSCSSYGASVRTSSKTPDNTITRRSPDNVKDHPIVPEALVHPSAARMVASQRAVARACGVADSTVSRLVAKGRIRRLGSLLDLEDALIAIQSRPRPGRPAYQQGGRIS